MPFPELAIAAPAPIQEADLTGRWEGALSVGGTSLGLTVRVERTPGGVQAFLDVPAQNVRGLAVTDLSVDGGAVRFAVPLIQGRFEGAASPDSARWTGSWSQGGSAFPLILTRSEAEATPSAPDRPQTPRPPFPYAARDVTFVQDGLTLAGTLTIPAGTGPFPAVVLLTGSGPQDRDSTLFDHKPFAVWADALTRRGVAVLRYDDRGVGGSDRGPQTATSEDFAADAAAAVAFLASQAEIDPTRIGLMGHSEGGMVAPLAVQNGAPAAFVVMLAGQAVPGADVITEQAARIAEASGAGPDQVAEIRRMQGEVMAAVVRNKDDGPAAARAAEAVLIAAGQTEAQARAATPAFASNWYRWFAAHDPAPALRTLEVPVLAIYGAKDVQVPADQNSEALRRLDPEAEIVVLPGLNHLLQTATTGLPAEYAAITETVAPEAISTVVNWVVRVTGAR